MLLFGLFSLLSGAVSCAMAYNQAVSLSFYSEEVTYWPDTAWRQTLNNPCGTIDHYTSMIGSRISVNFPGNRIVVGGMKNNHSGVLEVRVDDQTPFVENLYSRNVTCGIYFDQHLLNGTHNLTMTLTGVSPQAVEDGETTAVAHFLEITYWTPVPGTPDQVPTAVSGSLSSSKQLNTKAIVAGVICGVFGLAGIILVTYWLIRRRLPKRNDRHSFNPNLVYLPRLDRTTTTDTVDNDVKLQPYAKMEDEHTDTKATLQVPTSTLQVPPSGLRSRSRSPAPDRKPMP